MKRLKEIRIRRPSDFHTHLRSPAQVGNRCFRMLVRANCAHYRYVVVEPNTFLDPANRSHHIENVHDMLAYQQLVLGALPEGSCCRPLFLLKLTPQTTPTMISDAARAGCIGLKLYPDGVTTGAQHGGVSNFASRQIHRCLERMEELNLVFQIHPELPHSFCLTRERQFHEVIVEYGRRFPALRIFVEHMTDHRTVQLIHDLRQTRNKVYGTITGHHLRLTLDNVLGNVDHHCWPCAKYPHDQSVLIGAAISGDPGFISITDSAPHKYHLKHLYDQVNMDCACAGVFNPAEIAIPWLAQLFEERGELDMLETFTSYNGLSAYGLSEAANGSALALVKEPWTVPRRYDSGAGTVTPFMAGEMLQWRIKQS